MTKATKSTSIGAARPDLHHAPPENPQGRLDWLVAKVGKQPNEWNVKTLRIWGYHDLEADQLVLPGAREPGWKPKWFDRNARGIHFSFKRNDAAYEPKRLYPNLWRVWGDCLPSPEDHDGRFRLGQLLYFHCRQFALFCDASEEDADKYDQAMSHGLFWCIYEALTNLGRKTWTLDVFRVELDRQDQIVEEQFEQAAARSAELKLQDRKGAFGRPRSVQTDAVERIASCLGLSPPQSYKIYRDGSSIHAHRIKLAKAFSDDPNRNTPAKWQPVLGASKPQDRLNFLAYLESGTDQFEDDALSKTLGALRRQAEMGYLPNTIRDVMELRSMSVMGNGDDLMMVWDSYLAWRDVEQTKTPNKARHRPG